MYLPLYEKPTKDIGKSISQSIYTQTYDNQNFVLSFMHPHTPYRGLLLTFQLGNGKTYVASALAHLYNTHGYNVLFIAHNISTIENFKKEYKIFIDDNQVVNTSHAIKYMGITKFISSKYDISNHLVIIDEAHNIRENANRYKKLYDLLHSYDNIRLLIITATPMIDKIMEIESLRNLIEPNAPIAYSNKIHEDITPRYKGKDIGIGTLYISKFKGRQLEEYKKDQKQNNKDIYSKIRQTSLTVKSPYNPSIPLDEQSAKINALLESLVPEELCVVFSFFVTRGIRFLESVLMARGWVRWTDNNSKPYMSYAILEGETSIERTASIMENFNSIKNRNGKYIALLIGSSVMSESITLRNVQHVHILTPFWNYGQIRQAIGRVIRMRSHEDFQKAITVNIYLHATILEDAESIDIQMYKVAYAKDKSINSHLKYIKNESIWVDKQKSLKPEIFSVPSVDDRLVFKHHEYIVDCRECFESNVNKISWYKVFDDKLVCYDTERKTVQIGINEFVSFPKPYPNTITAWKSIIDDRIRITDLRNITTRKRMKRGKLICNMSETEIDTIATYLDCSPTVQSIIQKLKSINQYIPSQVVLE